MNSAKFNSLLDRLRAGDMSALEPIYTEYHRKMTVDASYIAGEDGEDVASAAIVKLVDYVRRNDSRIAAPDAFMRTLVKNAALDVLRSRKCAVELENAELVPSSRDMETAAVNDRDLRSALRDLPVTEREIAIMFYIYGVKIKDIAARSGMPVGTVKWRLNKIRNTLKQKLS